MAPLLAQYRRRWRRAVARHRRLIAAGLLAVAVAAALQTRAPAAPSTEPVLVAARDLPAGRTVGPGDVIWQAWLSGTAPRGAQRAVAGRVLASAVRAGEPITDARLAGPGLLTGQPAGTRAVTVRLADPSAASLVRPGDRVDVLAAAASGAPAPVPAPAGGLAEPVDVVVEGAVVLASPSSCAPGSGAAAGASTLGDLTGVGGSSGCSAASGAGTGDGAPTSSGSGVLVLAVDASGARRLAATVVDRSLSVAIRS